MEYLRLLLVDTDRNDFLTTRKLLDDAPSTYDYNLEWSPDFDSGIRAISSAKHDVYLIDLNIGHERAFELLRKTSQAGRRAPVIVLNGSEAERGDAEAMRLGAADFLDKDDLKPDALDRAIRYALQRKQTEEYQQVMRAELEHRVKNIFNQVMAIERHTMRSVDSLGEFKETFEKRLMALAEINTLLSQRAGESAGLEQVIRLFAQSFGGKIELRGDGTGSIELNPKAAQSLFMALYELSIVSVKHGALSVPAGKAELSWRQEVTPDGDRRSVIRWSESDGPQVYYPEKTGAARKLIELMIESQLRGAVDFKFAEGGIRCEMSFAAERPES